MEACMHRLNVGGIECAPNLVYEHNTTITPNSNCLPHPIHS